MEPRGDFGACRCCSSKGYHRDITKVYHSNGVREVYYEMFLDCYNLFLSTSVHSTLICASCVRRLRDACSFRALVVEAERLMLDALGGQETVFVNVPDGNSLDDHDIKEELQDDDVKMEPRANEFNDNYDDSDWEPDDNICVSTMKSLKADLIPGEAELLARFRPGTLPRLPTTRASLYAVCPGYVGHLDSLKGITVEPKMIEKLLEQNEFRRKLHHSRKVFMTEKYAQITNAATLIECSNITPFKSRGRAGFPCFYCRSSFETVHKIREHQEKSHRRSEARKVLGTYGAECLVVYVDITDLKCTICNENITNLNALKNHITKTHQKKMHLEYTDRVIPFKLAESNIYECQICGFSFETFGSIERHMNVHYRNHVCKECGTGFITKYRLKVHIKSNHNEGSFPCELCKKVYTSQQKHKNHIDTVHKMIKRFKCPKCPERFTEYFRRQKHMVTVHGLAPLQYKCNVCDKSFDRRYTLSRHMKRDHLEERDFQCELCPYNCFTNNELRVHMVKHNGERIHECSVCKKSYARKKTLKEHMRIHNNDRRFACAVCGQAFVQKCSLKGHIKTHHVEYSLQA